MQYKANRFNRFRPLSSQSDLVTALSLLSLAAIGFSKFTPLTQVVFIPRLPILTLVLGAVIVKRHTQLVRLFIIILVPVLIFTLSSNFVNRLQVYKSLYGQTLNLTATVQDDAAYNTYGDYEFNVYRLSFAEDGQKIPGRLRIRTKQNLAVYRGDRLFISGKLKPTLGSRTGSISYATVEVLASSPSWLEKLRLKFFASVYSSLPEPHASLGIGFLAGVRSSISKEFQDQLSTVGLTHIIAVSGYNLTILVLAIGKLGKKFSKYQKLVLSLTLIIGFLLVTGFSPSIVRAAVVSLISLTAVFFGRKVSALNLILISAAITAGFNPTYLWQDIGWWLSFLAFFGVLILAPALSTKVFKEKEPGIIPSIILESFSAQLMTAPLIAFTFGTFSVISLLSNVLVLPLIPLVMILVLTVGLVGLLSAPAALSLGILPKLVLTPIVWIIENLAALSFSSAQLKFSLLGMISVYLLLISFVVVTNSSATHKDPAVKVKP
jgi:competence protein ComEC